MSLSQQSLTENKPPYHTEDNGTAIRPSAAYGQPFCRMDFWWSNMPPNVRQGFIVMIGEPLEQSEDIAQYSWALLSKERQLKIIQQLGSNAMVAGFVRDSTDEFRRLQQFGYKQAGIQS